MPGWRLEHTYAELPPLFHTRVAPTPVREPALVVFNRPLARWLGLDPELLDGPPGAAVFAGNALPDGAEPLAQAYAGHQFGAFTALGDGRAILLGEQITPGGERVDIQLKGSGQTRFSRRGDGRAALGPMLREYIISEAMYALGIPTTRSLAVVTTGEPIYRETVLDGAVLTRVAASHIRVGTMEWAAARRDHEALGPLADYTRRRHYPELVGVPDPSPRLVRGHRRTAGAPDRALAARRVHPWRDEHRQHGPLGRDHRLRPMRVHGRLRSGHGVQLHRSQRAVCVREPAGHRPVEPRAPRRGDAAALRCRCRSGGRAGHGSTGAVRRRVRSTLVGWCAGQARAVHRGKRRPSARADDLFAWMQRRSADFTNTFRALSSSTPSSRTRSPTPRLARGTSDGRHVAHGSPSRATSRPP